MLDDESKKRVLAIKTAAVVDKHLYSHRLAATRLKSRTVDFVALATPTFYFALRFIAKGTPAQNSVEICWEFLAATLMILMLMKIIFYWDEKTRNYLRQLEINIYLANTAQNVYDRSSTITQKEFRSFIDQASKIENDDRDILGEVHPNEERRAYRQALRDLDPDGPALCPACRASARRFSPGSCQECGNKPIKEPSNA